MKAKIKIIVLVLAAVMLLASCGDETADGTNGGAAAAQQFTFTFQAAGEGAWHEPEWNITTQYASLGDALREAGIITETGFVTTVNGITADFDANGAWWMLTVDGEMAPQGVDDTMIAEGVTYAFVYTEG